MIWIILGSVAGLVIGYALGVAAQVPTMSDEG